MGSVGEAALVVDLAVAEGAEALVVAEAEEELRAAAVVVEAAVAEAAEDRMISQTDFS